MDLHVQVCLNTCRTTCFHTQWIKQGSGWPLHYMYCNYLLKIDSVHLGFWAWIMTVMSMKGLLSFILKRRGSLDSQTQMWQMSFGKASRWGKREVVPLNVRLPGEAYQAAAFLMTSKNQMKIPAAGLYLKLQGLAVGRAGRHLPNLLPFPLCCLHFTFH